MWDDDFFNLKGASDVFSYFLAECMKNPCYTIGGFSQVGRADLKLKQCRYFLKRE